MHCCSCVSRGDHNHAPCAVLLSLAENPQPTMQRVQRTRVLHGSSRGPSSPAEWAVRRDPVFQPVVSAQDHWRVTAGAVCVPLSRSGVRCENGFLAEREETAAAGVTPPRPRMCSPFPSVDRCAAGAVYRQTPFGPFRRTPGADVAQRRRRHRGRTGRAPTRAPHEDGRTARGHRALVSRRARVDRMAGRIVEMIGCRSGTLMRGAGVGVLRLSRPRRAGDRARRPGLRW